MDSSAIPDAGIPMDIIIYALIAGALVIFLRNVLGTKHGSERKRPNPFAERPADAVQADINAENPEFRARLQKAPDVVSHEPTNVDAGLVQIAIADRSFDTVKFIENAKDAFAIVVTAFADGDRKTLRDLLSDSVYNSFDSAITAREKAGQKVLTEVHAVRRADIIEARLEHATAYIGIRFVADETYALSDASGKTIAGNPNRVIEMTDVWVFSRDTRSRDPRWFVTETRDDIKEDDGRALPEAGGK